MRVRRATGRSGSGAWRASRSQVPAAPVGPASLPKRSSAPDSRVVTPPLTLRRRLRQAASRACAPLASARRSPARRPPPPRAGSGRRCCARQAQLGQVAVAAVVGEPAFLHDLQLRHRERGIGAACALQAALEARPGDARQHAGDAHRGEQLDQREAACGAARNDGCDASWVCPPRGCGSSAGGVAGTAASGEQLRTRPMTLITWWIARAVASADAPGRRGRDGAVQRIEGERRGVALDGDAGRTAALRISVAPLAHSPPPCGDGSGGRRRPRRCAADGSR